MPYRHATTKHLASLMFLTGIALGGSEARSRAEQGNSLSIRIATTPPGKGSDQAMPSPEGGSMTLRGPAAAETSYGAGASPARRPISVARPGIDSAFHSLPEDPVIQSNRTRVSLAGADMPVQRFLDSIHGQSGISIIARGRIAESRIGVIIRNETVPEALARIVAPLDGMLVRDYSREGGYELWERGIAPPSHSGERSDHGPVASVTLQVPPSDTHPVLPRDPLIQDATRRLNFKGDSVPLPRLLDYINGLTSLNIAAQAEAAKAQVQVDIRDATTSFALMALLRGINGVLRPVDGSPGSYELWLQDSAPCITP